MKKITVEKEEGIAEVIDRMINDVEDDLVIIVPKGSALVQSLSNFKLLKREAAAAEKKIAIESVDETVLAFAKESGLEHGHPLWRKQKESSEDASETHHAKKSAGAHKKHHEARGEEEGGDDADDEGEGEMEFEAEEELETKSASFFGKSRHTADDDDDDEEEDPRTGKRWLWKGIGVVVLIIVVLAIVTSAFGHVTVAINFKKMPWQDQANFTADKNATTINPSNNVIPAQIFTSKKNTTQLFPASGQADVSLKAHGVVTIFNDYSSAPQELVATTRFETPDGKIFRITDDVMVPGAKVTNGTITPSSISVPVTADKPGPDYNIGPVEKLTIPGFKGSPKYNGFYGSLTAATTGGFTGERAVPTTKDISDAKASTTAILQSALSNGLASTYPNNFKILDGATDVQITKLTVNTSTDDGGNFSVMGEATLQAIGFDEGALKAYLLSLAQSEEASSTFSTLDLNYSNVQASFSNGQVSFTLAANAALEPAFSADDFKSQIAGKSISDARTAISNLPRLADGSISAWPMWLWTVPSSPDKIQTTIN